MRATPLWTLGLWTLALGVTGCRNDCQQLCGAIQVYAEEDCGLTFAKEELKQCIKDQQRGDLRALVKAANEGAPEDEQLSVGDRLQACERNLISLREEVTCEDLEVYFSTVGSADTTGGAR